MPKATVSTEQVQKDLKTCPGGYVVLKKMDYGQKLERTQIATDIELEMARGGGQRTQKASVDIAQKKVTLFEYRHCIVDHNLYEDDEEQVKLNLHTIDGLSKLDPKIGDEIGVYIDELNNYEEDDELGN